LTKGLVARIGPAAVGAIALVTACAPAEPPVRATDEEPAVALVSAPSAALVTSARVTSADTRLGELIENAPGSVVAGERLNIELLRRFYARHGFAPVWTNRQGQAESLMNAVSRAGDHGLAPGLFHADVLRSPATVPALDRELLLRSMQYSIERKRYQVQLEHQANYDALTGLPNRTLLHDRLRQAVYAQRRVHSIAVVFIDLDHFKFVNDSLGHNVGDELLKNTAARLRAVLRDGDTVARLGGDEFVLILPEVARPKDGGPIAQKALDALAQPFSLDGHEVSVSASIGIATFPEDGDTVDALIRNADSAMFVAKQAGGNRYSYYAAGPADGPGVADALQRPLNDIPA
jgi:diguanylate cyclase (GGDEF)-like protein